MKPTIQIAHIITGLGTGGAEMMLFRLLKNTDRTRFTSHVLALTGGDMVEPIREAGITVKVLGMQPGVPSVSAIGQIGDWLRQKNIQIAQTWMYHANLLGGFAAYRTHRLPVVWGIHNLDLSNQRNKNSTLFVARAGGFFSGWLPRKIVIPSQAAIDAHARIGYRREKIVHIPNGFNLDQFSPDPAARASLRQELGVPADALLVGMAARFDPQKDHHNFLAAAGLVRRQYPNAVFVLCGDKITPENPYLARWAQEAGLADGLHLLGRRTDMHRWMSSMDVYVSSSLSESFPNVIGEALASGVPVAATDAGDSAQMVGEAGRIVPVYDPQALADAVVELLSLTPGQRAALGQQGRERIRSLYNITDVAARYQELYLSVLQGGKK